MAELSKAVPVPEAPVVSKPARTEITITVPDWRFGPKGDNYVTYHVVTRTATGAELDVWVRWSVVKQLIEELEQQADVMKAVREAKKRWHAAWAPPWAAQDPAFLEVRRSALQEMLQTIAEESCLDGLAEASTPLSNFLSVGTWSSRVSEADPKSPFSTPGTLSYSPPEKAPSTDDMALTPVSLELDPKPLTTDTEALLTAATEAVAKEVAPAPAPAPAPLSSASLLRTVALACLLAAISAITFSIILTPVPDAPTPPPPARTTNAAFTVRSALDAVVRRGTPIGASAQAVGALFFRQCSATLRGSQRTLAAAGGAAGRAFKVSAVMVQSALAASCGAVARATSSVGRAIRVSVLVSLIGLGKAAAATVTATKHVAASVRYVASAVSCGTAASAAVVARGIAAIGPVWREELRKACACTDEPLPIR